jgi:hypothetical protein
VRTVEPITPSKIDELVRFLPAFEMPGREFIMRWEGGDPQADGSVSMPYPVYTADVNLVFYYVSQPCWCDFDYTLKRSDVLLDDDAFIARSSIVEIRTLLTYCARGERFCAGFWGGVLKRGRVQAVLRRLMELRDSLNQSQMNEPRINADESTAD